MNNISKNLKNLILKERISENELSKRIGISQQVLNRIITGVNINPTLATILPIAQYFNIPLDDFVYEEISQKTTSSRNKNSCKVPFVTINTLQTLDFDYALKNATDFISIDMIENENFFALEMYDHSMEPKFPYKTTLILEKNKLPCTGDFCLIRTEKNQYLFRQIMLSSSQKKFIKCLNPSFPDYNLTPLPINLFILATLLESRTNYIS